MLEYAVVYKFSCPLKLKYFPFDKQKCNMKFASVIDNSLLSLTPYGDKKTQIKDVLDGFSQ